jgi:magnesium-transporting ATPase (P-type)
MAVLVDIGEQRIIFTKGAPEMVVKMCSTALEWWPLILLCFLPSLMAIEVDKAIRRH